MKNVNFYYVRHGETLFNSIHRVQGWCDSPLTAKGISDAEKARDALKDISFRFCYCSTSERCRDTAAIVLKGRDTETVLSKKLKEFNFGLMEGEYAADHQEELNYRQRVTIDFSDIGGDTLETESRRIREILKEIIDRSNDGDNVLIVSHGAVWMHMLGYLFSIDRNDYFQKAISLGAAHPVPNGLVCRFHHDGCRFVMDELYGRDPSFLKSLKRI